MDLKLQIYRGELGPEYVDFRGDLFKGSPEDEHRTVLEVRIKDTDLPEGMTDEDIKGMAESANKLFALLGKVQPSFAGPLSSVFGLAGSGPVKLATRVYDED